MRKLFLIIRGRVKQIGTLTIRIITSNKIKEI
jgi:hypothetical protein